MALYYSKTQTTSREIMTVSEYSIWHDSCLEKLIPCHTEFFYSMHLHVGNPHLLSVDAFIIVIVHRIPFYIGSASFVYDLFR